MSGDDFSEALKHYHQRNINPRDAAWGVAAEALTQQLVLQIANNAVAKLDNMRVALAHTLLRQLPPPEAEPIPLLPEEVEHEFDPRLQRVIDGIVRQKRSPQG